MPETISQPEPELTRTEQAQRVVAGAIAGQGVVRRAVLYLITGVTILALAVIGGPAGIFIGGTGLISLLLLNMTDGGLS